ncbi:uncharacterized protein TNCV_1990461 [Trichonephila clavipes]|nr:uncharacterized protein TNCV_1990461 [Trichonephila clavipes]
MASDLKFEICAFELFGTCFYKNEYLSEKPDILSTYGKEYHLDPENKEVYEESYYKAVELKYMFYQVVFRNEIKKSFSQFDCSPSSVFAYISRTCRRDGMFGDLTIFEFLFTSCAFALHLCFYCIHDLGYKYLVNYAHLCWAMYFDGYKKEFYSQGGWSQLKSVSSSYCLVLEFLKMKVGSNAEYESEEEGKLGYLNVMKAVNNYKIFSDGVHVNCKTMSKAWVKFRLQNFNKFNTSYITTDMSDPTDMKDVSLQLRRLCDPNRSDELIIQNQSEYKDTCKECTENIPHSLLKIKKLTLNDMIAEVTQR